MSVHAIASHHVNNSAGEDEAEPCICLLRIVIAGDHHIGSTKDRDIS